MKKQRPLNQSLFEFLVLGTSLLWSSHVSAGTISNVQMTPAAPAVLLMGSKVMYSFDYTCETGGVTGIHVYTLDDDGSLVSQSGDATFDSGHVTGSFTVDGPVSRATIRRLNVQIDYGWWVCECEYWCCEWQEWSEQLDVDANYYFGRFGSITDVQLDPSSPAVLLFNDRVNIHFNYNAVSAPEVLISFRPWSGGALVSTYYGSDPTLLEDSASGSAFFTTTVPGKIDEIELLVTQPTDALILADLRFPVSYSFSGPTAIRATTWGRLKTMGFASH